MPTFSKLCPWLVARFGGKGTKSNGMKAPGWPQNSLWARKKHPNPWDMRLSGSWLGLSPVGFYVHSNHGMVGKGLMQARISPGCGVRRVGPWVGSGVPQFLCRHWVSKDSVPLELLQASSRWDKQDGILPG